jgi:hypothetical protein
MTIGNYFQDICNHYDDIDYLKGTNYGYHSYSTHGVLDRVHPEDANAIGQTIYDIVMDTELVLVAPIFLFNFLTSIGVLRIKKQLLLYIVYYFVYNVVDFLF